MKGEDTLAIKLNVSNKKIDVYPLANLLRQGENNADAIEVQLPERYGEIDLSSLTYIMYGDSEIGTRASQELEKEVNDEGVLLRWKISRDFTAVAGALNLLLEGYLADGELIIKWIGGAIDVYSDPAGGRYPPPKSEIEKALSKMYAVVGRAEQSAESAKLSARQADESEKNAQKHAENARVSAENARMSALKSEQTAKAIEGEAQKVADTAQAGVTAIADAGAAQVAAVQAEGTKKVEEIKKIESLLPAPSAQDAGKVPMVNAAGTGYELGDVYTKSEADAIFARKDKLDLKVIETYYNMRRTGKVYQAKVWKFAANPTTVCEKLADNAGLICEPSTATTEGRDDYADVPLFDWRYCNYTREADGAPIPTAIEGMESYKESGAVDVGTMHMSFWWRIEDFGDYEIYTISDSPHPELGLKPWVECVRADGTVLPWCIGSAFLSSIGEDSLLHSLPNRKPERNQSYNNMIINYGKKGEGYHGAGACYMVYQQVMMAIKYGTKSSQNVYGGCTGYSVQLPASIERAEADTYFPIKKSDKGKFVVGSRVSIGYGGDNNSSLSIDRGVNTMHRYADSAEILAIEDMDEQNAKLVLSAEPFNTLPVQVGKITSQIYVSTMPWYTGTTKSVLGRHDGAIASPSGYTYPYRINGREYAVGMYEIASDTVMLFREDYSKDVYFAPKSVKRATSEAEIKRDYINLGNIPAAPDVADFWVGDIKISPEGSWYPATIGTGDRVGTGDKCYTGGKSSGLREYLQGGDFSTWLVAGATFIHCWFDLSLAGWNFATRD